MSKTGPILLIEDDEDDYELFSNAYKKLELSNELIWFTNAIDAMAFLVDTDKNPFIIFSDINLPRQSGIEFKKIIDSNKRLREKSVPFIFYSTTCNPETVKEAYADLTIQGFFQKPQKFSDIKDELEIIIKYWRKCKHPNSD